MDNSDYYPCLNYGFDSRTLIFAAIILLDLHCFVLLVYRFLADFPSADGYLPAIIGTSGVAHEHKYSKLCANHRLKIQTRFL
jgi:hypothetical protein